MDRDGPFARQFGHAAPMQILHHQYSAYLELAVNPSARQNVAGQGWATEKSVRPLFPLLAGHEPYAP
jgi:hypothetical protein